MTQASARPRSAPRPVPRAARPGHGRVTLQHVARAAGVTAITVSRYLREPALVARSTAARVRAALRETGYVPNKQAGLLASGRSNIVAVLLPNLANSIFGETAQGLSDTLQAAGHELLIASTGYSLAREEAQLRALLGWQPAAIVVTGRRHSPGARRLLEGAKRAGTPVVEVWDRPSAHDVPPAGSTRRARSTAVARADASSFVQVGFDHDAVGRAMAEHLLAAGHRQLAYVDSGVAEDYRAHERGQGFAAAVRAAGAQVSIIVAPPGDAFDAGRQVLDRLLDESHGAGKAPRQGRAKAHATEPARITAAAFANDHLASGALLEAGRRGVAVPQRLALLGFGDFAIARQLQPALSSVALPRYEIGATAAQALLGAMRKHGGSQTLVDVAWRIVVRGSSALPPGIRSR